ncbi:unnamed protein product [Lepeophtheirus salmonis]|uniref:(salmon louse) hypothetical protein n=1 Tax=Lepeophtheirus salmonis TaxID=72036 RepID=A0A7R8CL77_LEPSM|nr:unnamed protein product [Lepeophtheirus salmonis]CAF2820454.1 unnamed protein product [Lepeophtheirus salmonis]
MPSGFKLSWHCEGQNIVSLALLLRIVSGKLLVFLGFSTTISQRLVLSLSVNHKTEYFWKPTQQQKSYDMNPEKISCVCKIYLVKVSGLTTSDMKGVLGPANADKTNINAEVRRNDIVEVHGDEVGEVHGDEVGEVHGDEVGEVHEDDHDVDEADPPQINEEQNYIINLKDIGMWPAMSY